MAKDNVTAHVRKGVTIVRDGKRVRPEINKNFDFTAEEVEGIKKADAGALGPALDSNSKGETKTASTTDPTTGKPTTTSKRGGAPAKSTANETGEAGAADDAGSKTNAGKGAAAAGDDDL